MSDKQVYAMLKFILDYFSWSKTTSIQKLLAGGGVVFILSVVTGYWFCLVFFFTFLVLSTYMVSFIFSQNIPFKSEYLIFFVRSVNSVIELFTAPSQPDNNTLLNTQKVSDKAVNKIDQELKKIVDLLNRDYVKWWFVTFSEEEEFLTESQGLFFEASQNLKSRISKVNLQKCAKSLVDLFRQNITSYQISKQTYQSLKEPKKRRGSSASAESKLTRVASVEDAFSLKYNYHSALKNKDTEQEYLTNVIKLLLLKLFPDNFIFCTSAQVLVNEILLTNVVSVLLEKYSDPDFIYWCFIKLTSDRLDPVVEESTDEKSKEIIITKEDANQVVEQQNTSSELCLENRENTIEGCEDENKFIENISQSNCVSSKITTSVPPNYDIPVTLLKSSVPIIRVEGSNSSENDKGSNSCQPIHDSSIVNDRLSQLDDTSDKNSLQNSEASDRLSLSSYGTDDVFHEIIHDSEDRLSVSSDTTDIDSSRDAAGDKNNKTVMSSVSFYLQNGIDEGMEVIDSIDSATNQTAGRSQSVDSRLIFHDVKITGTEKATEFRSQNYYTLYVIQFEAMYFSDEGTAMKTGVAKRRFREFVNLNSRLDDKIFYKTLLKDIKGPKRWLTLPFKNMDKENVESRKTSLEQFLKSLIEIEAICNSEELREFLAYDGDFHIAFVKKSHEMSVPRIDKMLVRTVSGMFDKIKSLPSLSQDVISGIVRRETSVDRKVESKSADLGKFDIEFDTQDSPYPNHLDKFVYQHGNVTVVTTNQTEDGKKKAAELREAMLPLLPRLQGDGSESPDQAIDEATRPSPVSQNKNLVLSESVLDLGVQLGEGQDVWLFRQKVLLMFKIVMGRAFERFLEDEIQEITTEDQWQFYLQLLRETIWPDGECSEEPERTEEMKAETKQMARECLTEFFPGWLRGIVGLEEMDYGVDQVIQSFEYEKLNKNLIFQFLDILVEELFPEVTSEDLQCTLLSS